MRRPCLLLPFFRTWPGFELAMARSSEKHKSCFSRINKDVAASTAAVVFSSVPSLSMSSCWCV